MTNKRLSKEDRRKFNEWAVGSAHIQPGMDNVDYPSEGELITGLDSIPRVVYLRALGYKIDTMEAYAWAEINEMQKVA